MVRTKTESTHSDRVVTERVVHAVAEARDVDPLELPPLYDVLDPDALNALVTKPTAGDELITVSFTYTDRRITVRNDGVVRVGPEGNGHASGDDWYGRDSER